AALCLRILAPRLGANFGAKARDVRRHDPLKYGGTAHTERHTAESKPSPQVAPAPQKPLPNVALTVLPSVGVSARFVIFCTAICTEREHTPDQRRLLSIFRERVLH